MMSNTIFFLWTPRVAVVRQLMAIQINKQTNTTKRVINVEDDMAFFYLVRTLQVFNHAPLSRILVPISMCK